MWLAKRAAPQNVISVVSFFSVGLIICPPGCCCPTEIKERAEIISVVSFLSVGLISQGVTGYGLLLDVVTIL